jgi:putative ABC transport system permease protein
MLLNYLKISVRYLLRHGTFSIINLFGLTLGFLSFLVLALYVHDELSFDSFHRDADRIYRVIQHEKLNDGTVRDMAAVAIRLGPAAASEFPEVEMSTRFAAYGRVAVGNDLESRDYLRFTPAEANFFQMFNFPLKEGDPATALKEPLSIVVTESAALKFFGEGSPMGKTLWTDFDRNGQQVYFHVTGVLKENLANSHLKLNVLVSEATFRSVFDWYKNY